MNNDLEDQFFIGAVTNAINDVIADGANVCFDYDEDRNFNWTIIEGEKNSTMVFDIEVVGNIFEVDTDNKI